MTKIIENVEKIIGTPFGSPPSEIPLDAYQDIPDSNYTHFEFKLREGKFDSYFNDKKFQLELTSFAMAKLLNGLTISILKEKRGFITYKAVHAADTVLYTSR